MKMLYFRLASLLVVVFIVSACFENKGLKHKRAMAYDGPQVVSTDLDVVFSDSAKTSMKMKAKTQIILQNDDQEFPDGIFVEFYNEKEEVYSILKSKYAYFNQQKDEWNIKGDVFVENTEKGQKLETQEMFWTPKSGDIRVEDKDKVTITEPDQILYGQGLTAKDDFSYYKIKKVTGSRFL